MNILMFSQVGRHLDCYYLVLVFFLAVFLTLPILVGVVYISLMTNVIEYLFFCLLTKVSVCIFCPFLIVLFAFLLLNCKNSLYILIQTLSTYKC